MGRRNLRLRASITFCKSFLVMNSASSALNPYNIDSQYEERFLLHIETAELIPDEPELTLLFIQLLEIGLGIIPYICNTYQIPLKSTRFSSTRRKAMGNIKI
ncbi:hypothetical protein STEG23_007528, partial [Scotinomys teguina]